MEGANPEAQASMRFARRLVKTFADAIGLVSESFAGVRRSAVRQDLGGRGSEDRVSDASAYLGMMGPNGAGDDIELATQAFELERNYRT